MGLRSAGAKGIENIVVLVTGESTSRVQRNSIQSSRKIAEGGFFKKGTKLQRYNVT